ncbi:MAG: VOC family protein [Enterococcus sp.]
MTKQPFTVNQSGRNSVNPVIITERPLEVIRFIETVLNGDHHEDVLTYDPDGTIIHSEVQVDDTVIIVAERKPTWPKTPAFLQIYVTDVHETLQRAQACGGFVITEPTAYVGVNFARFQDLQGNLWWFWSDIVDYDWSIFSDDTSWEPTKEAIYIHDSLDAVMKKMK